MKFNALMQSLIESSRCLGVAQAKNDTDAIYFWREEVDRYSEMLKKLPDIE